MTTAPKLPEGLENDEDLIQAVYEKTRCFASIHLLRAAYELGAKADRDDAARYRWLREQAWFNGALCVVRDPKRSVRLGSDCPFRERLDEAIDSALLAAKEAKQ